MVGPAEVGTRVLPPTCYPRTSLVPSAFRIDDKRGDLMVEMEAKYLPPSSHVLSVVRFLDDWLPISIDLIAGIG